MGRQHCHVSLTADNFSGHFVDYKSRHIDVNYFEPNLMSHCQPLDSGIICCVKARYRDKLAIRALDLDDTGEEDIFKIDLLSSMKLLKEAWDEVTPETIQNCWRHVGITPRDDEEWEDNFVDADAPNSDGESDIEMLDPSQGDAETLRAALDIILKFAQSKWTLPQAEEQLEVLLGDGYDQKD